MFRIRPLNPGEAPALAELIFHSTNAWYESHGFGKAFGGTPSDCLLFPEVYENLDPGCCLVAEHEETGQLIGSCFYHPRETHFALGIMNTDPSVSGSGVARVLLQEIIAKARDAAKPLRLVSSAFNLDSFSLYNRQGFVPYAVFQDMTLPVPTGGLPVPPVHGVRFRSARLDDLPAIDQLERNVWETSRPGDWRCFIENHHDIWHVSVAELDDGHLRGALASVSHPGSNMLGPGIATDSHVASSLILTELNAHRGRSPVFLVPSSNTELVHRLYECGARNCEIHLAQCLGTPPAIQGVVLPTFMPETA